MRRGTLSTFFTKISIIFSRQNRASYVRKQYNHQNCLTNNQEILIFDWNKRFGSSEYIRTLSKFSRWLKRKKKLLWEIDDGWWIFAIAARVQITNTCKVSRSFIIPLNNNDLMFINRQQKLDNLKKSREKKLCAFRKNNKIFSHEEQWFSAYYLSISPGGNFRRVHWRLFIRHWWRPIATTELGEHWF